MINKLNSYEVKVRVITTGWITIHAYDKEQAREKATQREDIMEELVWKENTFPEAIEVQENTD